MIESPGNSVLVISLLLEVYESVLIGYLSLDIHKLFCDFWIGEGFLYRFHLNPLFRQSFSIHEFIIISAILIVEGFLIISVDQKPSISSWLSLS